MCGSNVFIVSTCGLLALMIGLNVAPMIGAAQYHRPDARAMAEQSQLVVTASVANGERHLVHPELIRSRPIKRKDGTVHWVGPDLERGIVGRIVKVRVIEVFKGNDELKGTDIQVFLPGIVVNDETPESLKPDMPYLLFLSSFDQTKYRGTALHAATDPVAKVEQFDARNAYSVVKGRHGTVSIIPKDSKMIEEIRSLFSRR